LAWWPAQQDVAPILQSFYDRGLLRGLLEICDMKAGVGIIRGIRFRGGLPIINGEEMAKPFLKSKSVTEPASPAK